MQKVTYTAMLNNAALFNAYSAAKYAVVDKYAAQLAQLDNSGETDAYELLLGKVTVECLHNAGLHASVDMREDVRDDLEYYIGQV